jgi:hypothetical protein
MWIFAFQRETHVWSANADCCPLLLYVPVESKPEELLHVTLWPTEEDWDICCELFARPVMVQLIRWTKVGGGGGMIVM